MTIINTEHAPGAIGPYSQAYETNGLVITSGQLPVNPADGAMPEMFDADHKLPLPEFPKTIGLICAPQARAEGDVITNVNLRWIPHQQCAWRIRGGRPAPQPRRAPCLHAAHPRP